MLRIITASNLRKAPFSQRCWASQREYAERIGASWEHFRIPPMRYPNRHKVEIILANTRPGDRVCWMDWDVECSADAVDLSERDDAFLAFDVGGQFPRTPFNNGLMLADRETFETIHPIFQRRMKHATVREELVTELSLREANIRYTLVPDHDLGMKHLAGGHKWN